MRARTVFLSLLLAGGLFAGLAPASQAAAKVEGSVSIPAVAPWLGAGYQETKIGSDSVTAAAFADACQQDREAHAAGNAKGATHVAAFLKSDQNGLDAFVFDLGKEVQGKFKAEGPGATELVPDAAGIGAINTYDLDLDFFTAPNVDAASWDQASDGLGCPNANLISSSHKCYSHSAKAHEETGCISGYKDAKKVLHGARFVMITASLNLVGPMPVYLTHS